MKICFISGIYPLSIGGAEYQAKILSEEIAKVHEVFFISFSTSSNSIRRLGKITIYEVLVENNFDSKILYLNTFKKMRTILEIEKPDRIYQRVLTPYTIWIARFAKKNKVPFILHIASEHSISFNSSLSSMIKRILFFKILSYNVYVILQTENQKEILKKTTDYPVFLFPNIMHDVDFINNYKAEKIILWIGKATPVKQLQLFLNLANSLKNEKISFVIISKFFDDDLSRNLLRQISEFKNITNLGLKDNDFINKFLEDKAYLLVNTSSSEGFSNTFIQAWLRGVPVISYNSNPNNLLTNYNMGYFCDGDKDKLYEAVSSFISNPKLYNLVSKEARKKAAEDFSVKQNVSKFITFIEKTTFNY